MTVIMFDMFDSSSRGWFVRLIGVYVEVEGIVVEIGAEVVENGAEVESSIVRST